jgi:hypothetical protein
LNNQVSEAARELGVDLLNKLREARQAALTAGVAEPHTYTLTEQQWAALGRQVERTRLSGSCVLIYHSPPRQTPSEVEGLTYLGTVVGVHCYSEGEAPF